MPELNFDVPIQQCLVRSQFLHNLESHHEEYEPCVVFGGASIPGRALLFHAMTDRGAQFGRLPIDAFCWKPCPKQELHNLEIWNAFSHHASAIEYKFLAGLRVNCFLRDRSQEPGQYLYTVDYHSSDIAEGVGDLGWKCAHIVKLDNGNYAALPNNRIFWLEPAFITKPFKDGERPGYVTNGHVFDAENRPKSLP